MKTARSYIGGDRYRFDFHTHTSGDGWAQFDNNQDASYFGTWINPFLLKIVTFAEGDLTEVSCDTEEEFIAEIRRMWDLSYGYRGMDPGFNEELRERLSELGFVNQLNYEKETPDA